MTAFVDESTSSATASTSADGSQQPLTYNQFMQCRGEKEVDRKKPFFTASNKRRKNKQPVSVSAILFDTYVRCMSDKNNSEFFECVISKTEKHCIIRIM